MRTHIAQDVSRRRSCFERSQKRMKCWLTRGKERNTMRNVLWKSLRDPQAAQLLTTGAWEEMKSRRNSGDKSIKYAERRRRHGGP